MKKILIASLFAVSAFGLQSCNNGDYDVNPAVTASGTNPLNPTGGGGGGGGGNNFNWTGTDPMSAKIDGTAWQASTGSYLPAVAGFPPIVSGKGPNNSSIIVNVPDNAAANTTQNFNSSYTATYSANTTSGSPNDVYSASLGSGGSVLVIENDATHIKGKFTFNGKNPAGTAITISEGYFNITK